MPKSKSPRFRRPKKVGMRKSKNADYTGALRGSIKTNLADFGSFTRRQLTFLTIAVLSFYLYICFAVMQTFGPPAGLPLFAGLLVFAVALGLVWWLHTRRFHGEQDEDQLFDEDEDLTYPGSQFVKPTNRQKKAKIDRLQFSEIEDGDIPLVVKPAPIIQGIVEDVKDTSQPSSVAKAKRGKGDLEAAKQHYRSGTALLKQDQSDEAIAAFQAAIELKPDLAQAHESLGRAYLKQEDAQAAIVAFQTAIAYNSELVSAYEGLGRSYLQQERLEDAKAAFQKAIQLDPRFFRAYDGLGRTLFKAGQAEAAIVQFQKALEINPQYQSALNMLKKAGSQSKKA